ncbi:MAG TPA: DUF5690 family protein [Cyclobacteriaceae bacterium]|nr:DUF5690 family protein [Cyclobacteriaceae bacterium]
MNLSYRDAGLRRWLAQINSTSLSVYLGVTAFCLYSCVYAFRKTFSVAVFEGISFLGIDYKIWLVTFQVIGYAASKFAGIKIISELKATSRSAGILIMTGIAGVSWLFFAITPRPYNLFFLFTNGFPLGLVWGMVFGFLEGRRDTDALGAGMAISFIFSAGLCKSVGAFVMRDWHVSETWMPFTTALLFTGPLLFFLWLLDQAPPPTALDEQLRTRRQPMDSGDRRRFIVTFLTGLILIVLLYAMLTAFRDFRDNFSAEIWKSLGKGNSPEIFTVTEVPISLACLIIIGGLVLIRNNFKALVVIHGLIIFGALLIGASTFAFTRGWLSPQYWMTLVGFGLYLGYIPFNSSFFDRMLGAFRIAGTVGFVMYLADSVGYLASVGVLFYKQFGQRQLSLVEFFTSGAYVLSASGALLAVASLIYFNMKKRELLSR